MPKLQLGFHGTFALKKQDLLKILQGCKEDNGLNDTKEKLMDRTGLGNQKLTPMKSWAVRTGLVSDNFLSAEGKIVLEKDPYLESPLTDWLMHFYLSFGDKGLTKPPEFASQWGGWSYFVYEFLPEHRNFTIEDLVQHSATIFEGENEKNLKKNLMMVLKAYAVPPNKDELPPLTACRFITEYEGNFRSGEANLPNLYLIGYFLAKLWQRDFGKDSSVVTSDILEQKMGLAPVLGIEKEALQEYLNGLETLALIEQRRTVSPSQVICRWDNAIDLLEKAYDY